MASETLQFASPRHLNQLYFSRDENLQKVEEALRLSVASRENWVQLEGPEESVQAAARFFQNLEKVRGQGMNYSEADFHRWLGQAADFHFEEIEGLADDPVILRLKKTSVVPKTINQKRYLNSIRKHDVVFGIGPAGTGKTFLAMAAALSAVQDREVSRIIITRPAVEAGEALGFLPGELEQKLDPYLRPIYDAMFEMVGKEEAARMREKGMLEIAPLAYMRGRTLSNAFVILDEAQNTTPEQMMMFLTRLGENSKMVITGDITQIDLPRSKNSGLRQAARILARVRGIDLFYFEGVDVVRHPLVRRIIAAYEAEAEARGS